jgi:hypothetical protein
MTFPLLYKRYLNNFYDKTISSFRNYREDKRQKQETAVRVLINGLDEVSLYICSYRSLGSVKLMSSRSAKTKLKVILVIDLIIVALAAGAYFYLQSEGLIASAPKPAEFAVTNLTINPPEVEVGDPVSISVNVTNIGDVEGAYMANLTINDVLVESQEILLMGKESKIVGFTVFESTEGNYSVKIADLTGVFMVKPISLEESKIVLSNLKIEPYEVWVNETVTATLTATNPSGEPESLKLKLLINGSLVETKQIELSPGASTTVEFKFNAPSEGKFLVKINTLSGTFLVVPTGYHTLMVGRSGGGSKPLVFTLNGVTCQTPYTELLPVGVYTISAPTIVDVGTGVLEFSHWSDLDTNPTRTINLQSRTILVATYIVISGYASCPSLFIWNGTQYVYVTEVSNAGWLGYMDYINEKGEIVFGGGNPWDYIKLDKKQLQLKKDTCYNYGFYLTANVGNTIFTKLPLAILIIAGIFLILVTVDAILVNANKNREKKLMFGTLILVVLLSSQLIVLSPFTLNTGEPRYYYDVVLFQQWDEIFYLDAAYMLVVDHPVNVDVYSTCSNYFNRGFNGKIYTVSKSNLLTPIAAYNEKGEDVLHEISYLDGVFTYGNNGLQSPSWDNITLNQLTLNLGDLSEAKEIKLVVNGMVDWGPPEYYYEYIDKIKSAFAQGLVPKGTKIYSPPSLEIMDLNGNWVQVPQDKQMPMPSDYVPRTFAVNLTGLFPDGVKDYRIRITNFFNVTFDYIGIDVTPHAEIKVYKINPIATLHPLEFGSSSSTASGNFTRYGDVTPLLLEADDMFVIGRQGDKVSLKFYADDLPPLDDGMERDYFLFVACWFKDPPGNWGYGFDFNVEPLPFLGMSGFPYPPTESYPYDEKHLAYISEYNTRVVKTP